jgi:Fe-S-cluster containining protein
LEASDAARAGRVRQRASEAAERLPQLPAGRQCDDAEFEAWLEVLPDDGPCPVLDPETGTCDLYAARPVTCRVFGPPVRWGGDAVGVCELCFEGASDEEIAACEVQVDVAEREAELLRRSGSPRGQTVVALALG